MRVPGTLQVNETKEGTAKDDLQQIDSTSTACRASYKCTSVLYIKCGSPVGRWRAQAGEVHAGVTQNVDVLFPVPNLPRKFVRGAERS